MIDQTLKAATLATLSASYGTAVDAVKHELLHPRGFPLTERQTLAVLLEMEAEGLAEQREGEWWRVVVTVAVERQAELF